MLGVIMIFKNGYPYNMKCDPNNIFVFTIIYNMILEHKLFKIQTNISIVTDERRGTVRSDKAFANLRST